MSSHQPRPSISAFFPAYNDWATIPSQVLLVSRTLRELCDDWEVIVVNDGSRDHTEEVLKEVAALAPNVRLVTHATNRGYGGALRSGFEAATKDWIFYTDGDAQYDVTELRLLWDARSGVDMVNGYKISRSDPLHRIVVGKLYHWIVRFAFGLESRDVDCDFRLLRRDVFERIALTRDTGLICVELVTKIEKAGFSVRYVPVHHYHRLHGRSQFFNLRRVGEVALGLGRLWWELIVQRRIRRADVAAAPVSPEAPRPWGGRAPSRAHAAPRARERRDAVLAGGLVDRIAEQPLLFHYLRKLPELNYRATKARIRRIAERRAPRRVLDLGCGTGEFADLFEPPGYLGLDVHPGYVELARRLHPRHRFVCHDGTTWPGDGDAFDLTLINGVLHHLDDATARALLGAAVRHTRPGGSLVVIEDTELADAGPLAGLVHALDHGHFIRSPEAWARLVGEFFAVSESETYRSGICPYHLMCGTRA